MDEINNLKKRAGISTNWDRNAAARALDTIDHSFVDLLDELYGIEDEAQRRALVQLVEEAGKKLSIIKRTLPKIQ